MLETEKDIENEREANRLGLEALHELEQRNATLCEQNVRLLDECKALRRRLIDP